MTKDTQVEFVDGGIEFIGNPATKEVHHVPYVTGSCQIDEIEQPQEFEFLRMARELDYDPCSFCFKSEK